LINIGTTLAVLALISAFGAMYYGIRMANELRARGHSANPLFTRWMIFNYMAKYRRITLEETGRVGPLYHACVTSSTLAALLAFGALFILT
jgi:hypothetical protein